MRLSEYKALKARYGEDKARKAVAWFVANFSPEIRKALFADRFCRDNECLWW